MERGIICAPSAFLYAEPSESSEVADEVFHGMEVEVLEEKRGWRRVRTQYRYSGYLRRETMRRSAWFARVWREGKRWQVISPFADVLARASFRSPIRAALPRGSIVLPLERETEGWREVRLAGGERGFLRQSQIQPMPAHRLREEALRRRVAQAALSYLGAPYRWGGKSPAGIDCSGLCSMAYLLQGVMIYRDSALMEGFPIKEIPQEGKKMGDLLYFPGHIALYLGEGKYIHATGKAGGEGVVLNSLEPGDPDYRADLAESLLAVGSLFPREGNEIPPKL
ncbi:MAG: C40 family peptidase [Oscillospiraceae bacterium]|nr:C40 family peptidase [Oscillospiraceae bacterium]